ncbi:hypothetical protein JZ751_009773 [Albula glossodonta]|uniref:Uncharacterized protein n=1 Tax=Albula glossodonta TaxID=121402 RepID=A0A8T2P9B5_9TELE|nr:hypothetical protein JZ751_009773 [Albula glossodonta]
MRRGELHPEFRPRKCVPAGGHSDGSMGGEAAGPMPGSIRALSTLAEAEIEADTPTLAAHGSGHGLARLHATDRMHGARLTDRSGTLTQQGTGV